MKETLTIPRRFNGPLNSANGGWTSGSLAKRLTTGCVSVSLRAPPPLDTPLQVTGQADGGLSLHHNDIFLAMAQPDAFDLAIPPTPSLLDAERAAAQSFAQAQTRQSWPYAKCFACGVSHDDGLCITPGPIPPSDRYSGPAGVVAASWKPKSSYELDGQETGIVSIEGTWAALDCPAGFAWSYQLPEGQPIVTARMSAKVHRQPTVGETYIVMGWPISQDGRKLHAGTALVTPNGQLIACSLQLWLQPKPAL